MEEAYKEPTFLTDKNHIIVLETITDVANAAIPGSLEPFKVLVPNTSDGATEKHLLIIETNDLHITVKMGSSPHPMPREHSISFICLLTQAGEVMRVYLNLNCESVTRLTVKKGDIPAAAYACCNLYGFWKTEA